MGKVDDQILDNPKIAGLSPEAKLTYFAAIVHCKQQMTDGLIAAQVLPIVVCKAHATYVPAADTIAAELVTAGLWEPVEGGWLMHDWLDWNDSAQNIRERAEAAKERKRKWVERQRDAVATQEERVAERVPNASIDAVATSTRRERDGLATPISDNPYPISEREECENLTSFDSHAASGLENRDPPPRGGDPAAVGDLLPAVTDRAPPATTAKPAAARTRAPAKPAKPRARDPVWDALDAEFGPSSNDADRARRNKAAKLLHQTLKTHHIEEFQLEQATRQLCAAYAEAMPGGSKRTPIAVASNADLLVAHIQGRNRPSPSRSSEEVGYGVIG